MSAVTIGILGGMGPRATVEFEARLITKFSGGDQSIPSIITVNNGGVADRSAFLTGDSTQDPLDGLLSGARLLQQADVGLVCMPCNTAHASQIMGRLQALVPLPIIDMPTAALDQAVEIGAQRVLILGTTGTIVAQIYDIRATDVECIYPDNSQQLIVMRIIRSIKHGKVVTDKNMRLLEDIITNSCCEAAILACTELSLLPNINISRVTIIDSQDALIDRCLTLLTRYTSHKEINRVTRPIHNPRTNTSRRRRTQTVRSRMG